MKINVFGVESWRRCFRGGNWQRQRYRIKKGIQNRSVFLDEGVCKNHPFLLLTKLDVVCCSLQDFGNQDQVSSHRRREMSDNIVTSRYNSRKDDSEHNEPP